MDMIASHFPTEARRRPPPPSRPSYVRETVKTVTSAGPMTYHVVIPERPRTDLAPLLTIHGISREATAVAEGFAERAAREGRIVVAPHFSADAWPVFQRPTRKARPDIALLDLMEEARRFGLFSGREVNLFGFSGGGQLAHRFAMLYPHLVASLHLGAAGWYCMPDAEAAYPYGLGQGRERDRDWSRRMADNLDRFLDLPVSVYVGVEDDDPAAPALRRNPALDAAQGADRRARAAAYVGGMKRAGCRIAELIELPRCGHAFTDCIRFGGLADRVLARSL
ncbi:MAG: hypothetical protein AAFN79_01200 [Pseudomonadota bacterium]